MIENNLSWENENSQVEFATDKNLPDFIQEIESSIKPKMFNKGTCRYKDICNCEGNINQNLKFHYLTKNCPYAQSKLHFLFIYSFISFLISNNFY